MFLNTRKHRGKFHQMKVSFGIFEAKHGHVVILVVVIDDRILGGVQKIPIVVTITRWWFGIFFVETTNQYKTICPDSLQVRLQVITRMNPCSSVKKIP